jgi:phosphate transport system substrate-binding protein
MFKKFFLFHCAAFFIFVTAAEARDQIRIVGSSTVFPFATAVAEQFGRSTNFKTPVVESTGSGGGMKLFCAGIGVEHPDITNASRRIKKKEFDKCTKAGIGITEVKVGFDGIVLANAKSGPAMKITRKQIFLALAAKIPNAEGKMVENPYKRWKQIDASLPNVKIEVLGPPPTSGTRDAFAELALEGGCKKFDFIKAMKKKDKKAYKKICHTVREDGAYIEAGENDNLIVNKLVSNPDAFGVFGFSFLDQNSDKLKGTMVDGVNPEFELIAGGEYPVSRSLFFYIKHQHVGVVPGIKEFGAEFTNERAWGPDGYLVEKGLIPLPEQERNSIANSTKSLSKLAM